MDYFCFEFQILPNGSRFISPAIDLYRKESLRSLWWDSIESKTGGSRNFSFGSCECNQRGQLHV